MTHIQECSIGIWESAPDNVHISGLNAPVRPINPVWTEWVKRRRPNCLGAHLFQAEALGDEIRLAHRVWLHQR